MNLIMLLLMAACLQVSATGFAQSVTLDKRNATLKNAFEDIYRQTGYQFVYPYDLINHANRVSIEAKDMPLEKVLMKCFKDQPFTYMVIGNAVVIRSRIKRHMLSQEFPAPIRVVGKVTDSLGKPLIGVTVKAKSGGTGSVTGTNGSYEITVPDNAVLVVSYVGYLTQTVPVNGRSEIDIVLKAAVSELNQLVVVGYGTQKKKTLTGSVASLKGEDVIKSPVMNVSNSLAGRIPGVSFTARSGEPGNDAATIRIRGVNTLGNNDPLVVVDGIPGRSLDRIDPNSIASISVLKDASAAIYGSQAGNGVILITTKQGQTGKPKVNVNVSKGFTQPTRIPKMTDAAQYATALNELDVYAGGTARYSDEDIQKFRDGSDPWGHPNTNWFDAVLKNWSSQLQGDVSVSGGSQFMKYFVDMGAKSEDAFYKHSGTKYKQYNLRTNLNFDLSKDISLAVGVVGRLENSNFPGAKGSGSSIFSQLLKQKPIMPAYWPNGKIGPDIERGENPAALATNLTGFTDNKYYVLNTDLKLDVKIPWIEGLSLSGTAAFDKGIHHNVIFTKPWSLYSWDGQSYDANHQPILTKSVRSEKSDPTLTESMEDDYSYLINGIVQYKNTIGSNHDIGFLAGIESRGAKGGKFDAYRRYFVSTALPQLDEGGTKDLNNSGSGSHSARLNYFGRINYDYKQKYLLEFVWRVDGSYIFPEKGRFGFFPGVSVGWRLSDEDFWKNSLSSISDNVKIRASYGLTGNDRIDAWQYLSTYGFGSTGYIFNITDEAQTLQENRIPNPNVTWEVAKQADVGIDASFLHDKLNVTFDYFDYHRSKILWQRNASVPTSTGLTLPKENIGKTRNQGFDFDVAYSGQIREFKFTVSVNGGLAKNRILFWDETPGVPEYQRFTGHPMPTDPANPGNDLYYQAIGIFKDQAAVDKYPHWPGARPGDVIFKDVNGDGKIDADDRVRSDKTDIPTFNGGLGLNLQYKHFDLSVLFQVATGAQRYLRLEPAGNFGNYLLSDFEDRWTPDNINGTKPRMFDRTDQYYRSQRSTYLLHNTNYVRLRNFELGYSLPDKAMKRIGIDNLRVFVKGYNIFTYSPDFTDFDPSDNNQGGSNYPPQRVISGGLSISL